ncbi:hypothetical protein CS533_02740 [Yersinia bercovieri]|uniref:Uncharacterized protein n=1 Tax=Yersinia bercovieri TaxID=634 RepID=A0A2G4U886_YERBE|nr:hypothetical protein [Yersinia bercovieri]PHZ28926.1 hypothetical protein CS533_02740 [Yersinia bercovieri]
MAATTFTCQLYESKGLCKIVHFTGLDYDLILHPYVYGELLVTTQPVYYLEELDSIAKISVQAPKKISEIETEYLIDNYLFKYSLMYESSRICSKITTPAFWRPDFSDFYLYHDQRHTRALTLDPLNDESILEIKGINGNDWCFTDYCIPKEFIDSALSESALKIIEIYKKKIFVKIMPDEERDGYFGKLRLLETDDTLLDYTQALSLEDCIDAYRIRNKASLEIKSNLGNDTPIDLPIEKISSSDRYSPLLLSYYFSGLRERNPLISFIGYYNVLEYYLEEAPNLLGHNPSSEKQNLRYVISLITSHHKLHDFIITTHQGFEFEIEEKIMSSSGIEILGVKVNNNINLINDISDWVYLLRCAIVHSKKSRKGKIEAIFEPYSIQSNNINSALKVVKWLSQQCIIKDFELSQTQP